MPRRSKSSRELHMDARIVASWEAHEDAEPDISTERLMGMVENDTGADVSRIIEALENASLLSKEKH